MDFRTVRIEFKYFRRHSRSLQIGVIIAFWLLGETVARLAHIPLPGGILGLFAVLMLLASGHLHTVELRRGASLLLSEMLLFFVPAVLAVLDHRELLGLLGLKIFGAVLGGTMIVMGGTALVVDFCFRVVGHER